MDTPKLLRIIEKELRVLLTLEPTGYWETHFDFGTGGARKAALIGGARLWTSSPIKSYQPPTFGLSKRKARNCRRRFYDSTVLVPSQQGTRLSEKIDEQIFTTEAQQMRHLKPTAKIEQGILRLHKKLLCGLALRSMPYFGTRCGFSRGRLVWIRKLNP